VAALIRENRLAEAEVQIDPVLKAAPNSAVALNLLGTIRAKQGKLSSAELLFLRAVRSDRTFIGARMNLAYLYLLKGVPAKAIPELREVVKLAPDNEDVLVKLGELLTSQGQADECINLIERFKLARSLSAPLLVVLGDALSKKGNWDRAEEAYLQALEGKLENAPALLGLAQVSQARKNDRDAMLYLSRVGNIAPDSPEFLYKFALIALKSAMSDVAKTALEKALKLKPEDPAYLLALGVAWLRKPDLFEAEKVFRRVLKLQPHYSPAQLHLGYVLLNQKKYLEARELLEKSARGNPNIPEVFYYLGLVAQEQNDDLRAVPLFEKAISKVPSYAHARTALGVSFMKLKNYSRARQELEMAVKLDPEEPKAHYNLALLYARLKDTQRAQEEMRIVETLKSKNAAPGEGDVIVLPAVPRPF
jgi:tetratricopeptide (TPR) repeat protein